ncbi:hypothetical protein KC678_02930 [Candidatus Dojkabacteria bacterium]|uniref:Uncharacterized protein n=1 Tax=Candidatus Dojkabacteria bacterium TaxID=2099670 RepID=A0A955I952_9BACT|nr:hypothetical protein [Candidatus Dojkabacteria bacterium]
MNKIQKIKISVIILVGLLIIISPTKVFAQSLNSSNYTLQSPNLTGSSGIVDSGSTNYSTVFVAGDPTADSRLESTSYSTGVGFPNGIYANVPLVKCFETNTDDSVGGATDTSCEAYSLTSAVGGADTIAGDGMQGICGTPGCYDRAKIEIDAQNNPIDTLYLVSITDGDTATEYFLQSDNTLSTGYDINDYQTICQIEGYDPRTGSGCETSSDPDWDDVLQQYNVLNLHAGVTYTVKVKALNGDYTESSYSPTVSATTEYAALVFDIDIDDSGGTATETDAPYNILLGDITDTTVTATDRIWLDMGTNVFNGFTLEVENTDLTNGTDTIPSTTEDLSVDLGADGGYGLKIDTYTEDGLGPIIAASLYDTVGANEVGALSSAPATIFSTNTTGSNQGPISGGRASVMVKAKAVTSTPPGAYTDLITFLMTGNP